MAIINLYMQLFITVSDPVDLDLIISLVNKLEMLPMRQEFKKYKYFSDMKKFDNKICGKNKLVNFIATFNFYLEIKIAHFPCVRCMRPEIKISISIIQKLLIKMQCKNVNKIKNSMYILLKIRSRPVAASEYRNKKLQ